MNPGNNEVIAVKTVVLALLASALVGILGCAAAAQISLGMSLPLGEDVVDPEPFVLVGMDLGTIGFEGGIWWPSLENIGNADNLLAYYGRGRLGISVLPMLKLIGLGGMSFLNFSKSDLNVSFYQIGAQVELALDSAGIPISIFAAIIFTTATEKIEFGRPGWIAGLRVNIVSWGTPPAQEVASQVVMVPETDTEVPSKECCDRDVLRRWRQAP